MLAQIGASKVRNANKRLEVENKFLGSLSVQCDDESLIDSVINDDGQISNLRTVVEVIDNNAETVRFVRDGVAVAIDTVKASLSVVDGCRATIKRFRDR